MFHIVLMLLYNYVYVCNAYSRMTEHALYVTVAVIGTNEIYKKCMGDTSTHKTRTRESIHSSRVVVRLSATLSQQCLI